MVETRVVLSLLLLIAPSWSELRKTFHSKISGSSSRLLFSHYNQGRDRGHDHHHQSFKKQLESTTVSEIENEVTTLPTILEDPVAELSYERSLPLRVLNCMLKLSLMECSKMYVLQNMESRGYNFETSGNLTHDIQQILLPSYQRPDNKLFEDRLLELNSSEVDRRINHGLALLFNERQADITFLPGFRLRVSPSKGDILEFSIKKQFFEEDEEENAAEGRARNDRDKDDKKNRRGNKKIMKHLMQLGVPAVLLPSMLLASVMPMMIPALKFATFFTSFVNHAALVGAVMYLAKQHAQEQEEKQTVYFNAGYN
ncbi:uncharacterized protein LOC131676254 [Topomyia yanbarensis]|uniref:uncharacterized protein LOC131676254 n=1 Tax=Topomyia yanbarensis TaxID=2498891 RepID=UPI00273BCF18|nr:uncharacterized protein LOC131676254 [Topomyia yanbarensis]